MQKFWSLLFLTVPIFCLITFAIAPANGWWLPENISPFGRDVDRLFYIILGIVTVAFLGTQAALFYTLFRYADTGVRSLFIHTNHKLEFWWTIVPAAILLFIALAQFNAWRGMKVQEKFPGSVVQKLQNQKPDAEVLAGQFEWRIRYPGADGQIGTLDDVQSLNDLHVPVNEDFVIMLRSRDVLHSFFLPNLRVKQDAVPGMPIPVWFRAEREGDFDLVCAELCGWGHYKMRGRLTVQPAAEFANWLETRAKEQEVSE